MRKHTSSVWKKGFAFFFSSGSFHILRWNDTATQMYDQIEWFCADWLGKLKKIETIFT